MNALSYSSHKPSIAAQALAPVARVWQRAQDGVARFAGFENAGNAAVVVGLVGLTGMAVASIIGGPIAPAMYGYALGTAKLGGIGVVENYATKKIADSDGKGTTSNS